MGYGHLELKGGGDMECAAALESLDAIMSALNTVLIVLHMFAAILGWLFVTSVIYILKGRR